MKYLLQNYPGSSQDSFEQTTEDERQAIVDEYLALRHTPGIITGEQLQPVETATTVRVHNGEALLRDGPFVDAKEYLGGFFVFEADDLDAARAWPRVCRRRGWAAPSRCVRWWSDSALLDEVFREEWGRVLATLVGQFGDFDLAEEATQEAFAVAAERWPRDGTPPNAGAWLTITARNRAIDRIRREPTLAEKTKLLEVTEARWRTRSRRRRSPTSGSS